MNKCIAKVLCIIMVLGLFCPYGVLAEEVPVSVNIGATSIVYPGEEAVITVDVTLNPGFDIQGVQIDFDFSENFPEIKKTSVILNTTGWGNCDISQKKLLGVGTVITQPAKLVGKIMFDIPEDVALGTEYVFTPSKVLAASAASEIDAVVNVTSVKIVVPGGTSDTEIKPEDEVKPEPETNPEDENKPEPEITPVIPSAGSSTSNKQENPASKPNAEDTAEKENAKEELPWENPFSDIKEDDWFFEDVRYVFDNGLMSGVDMKKFAPEESLTRAMLVTILYRFEGSPETGTFKFSDVPRGMWYTKGVDWAAYNGIVSGVGDGNFEPDSPITREQIATIFYNYTKFKQMDISARKELTQFTDFNKISSWANASLEWAVASGLIGGKGNNTLDPLGNATRAETSAIIKRFAKNIIKDSK